MNRLLLACAVTQLALLPAYLLYLWVVPQRAAIRFQWLLHRLLLGAVILLPFLSFLPLPHLFAPTGSDVATAVVRTPGRTREEATSVAPATSSRAARALSPPATVGLLCGAGALFFAARIVAQKRREASIRRGARVRRFGRLRVVVSSSITLPFSSGLLRPAIYLPDRAAADPGERGMVLAHEGMHLRRGHYAWNLFEALLAGLFWFNPAMHLLSTGGRRIRELLCDQAVSRRFPPPRYGELLARTAERSLARRELGLANGWLGRGMLTERVRFLLEGGPRRTRVSPRLAAGLAGAATALALVAALPFLPPAAAGGAQERAPVTVGGMGEFPADALFPLTVGSPADTTISDCSRMERGEQDNLISLYLRLPSGSGSGVIASTSGEVTELTTGTDGRYTLVMRSANGHRVLYGYLASVAVRKGQMVAAGESLGWVAPGAGPENPAITISGTVTLSGSDTVTFSGTEYGIQATKSSSGTHGEGELVVYYSGYGYTPGNVDLGDTRSPGGLLRYEVEIGGAYVESMILHASGTDPDGVSVRFEWGKGGAR